MMTFQFKCESINEEVVLENVEFNFLYSTLFKMDCKFELGIFDQDKVDINGDKLNYLHDQLKKELIDLLENFYREPGLKERSKHPTRYEKISFEEKNYIVDYTLSRLGRLMFVLFLRLDFLKRIMDLNQTMVVYRLE